MTSRAVLIFAAVTLWSVSVVSSAEQRRTTPPPPRAAAPTYAADVAPILYKHCTECHRPGEIAPMSLMTYAEARPWAKAMRDEVADGRMPPWHADPAHGTFRNARVLTAAEKETLTRWANAGAPEGRASDAPKPPSYSNGWRMGTPDVVFTLSKPYAVKQDGMIDYQYFDVPTHFTEDKFVRAVEIRPGNREVVHHALLYVRVPPGGPRRTAFSQPRSQQDFPDQKRTSEENAPTGPTSGLLGTFAPGTPPMQLPDGAAIRIRAGTTLVFQMHYTTNGKAASDQTSVGLIFSDAPPADEVRATHFMNPALFLPAGAASTQVDSEITFAEDMKVWGIFPHTHLRGKRWKYEAIYPDGRREVVLSVPNYDFNWQTYYELATPLVLPKGTKLLATAFYDNSAANPANPDAKSDVRWGDQTWEEMQYTGLLISFVHPAPVR
ncbi:MAG: thiol-disulfide isomerase [Acidobacteriota bacterium]|nr:thiol-disulfide isomerase [Acidobacteriota bacterium]